MTYLRALQHCRDLKDGHFPEEHEFVDDISAMLTAMDLHAMIRYEFHRKIRLVV